jgi:hypothetical protein
MTYLDVVFRYGTAPGENELRAIDGMREVYGVRRVDFNEAERTVRVEFDASRLKTEAVARLLRQAGVDVRENIPRAKNPPRTRGWGKAVGEKLNARGAQENLWPKSSLERPVARHFVWSLHKHIACRL